MIPPSHLEWLRTFPLFVSFGEELADANAVLDSSEIPSLDTEFWRRHTTTVESIALTSLSDGEIDDIFGQTAAIIDEDLLRFDPMVQYLGSRFADGDHLRIQIEQEIAHAVKRDLAWLTIELLLDAPGFFTCLKTWYDAGRWPHGWDGSYPAGKPVVT